MTRIEELMDARDSPRIGVAVNENFEPHSVFGAAELLFQAGSISKSVTALVALELCAAGELALDRDVNETLRAWQLPGDERVTLRQLLTHTAGVGTPFIPGYPRTASPPTLLETLAGSSPSMMPPVSVEAPAGAFRYSGGGYAVVQQVIVDATGRSFADVAADVVLDRLGMTDSTFEQTAAPLADRVARDDWHVYPQAAAAGLWTTPRDLARFVAAVQRAHAGRPSPVDPGTASLMLTPVVELPAEGEWNILPSLGLQPPDRFGIGFFLDNSTRLSNLGGAFGFFSLLSASTTDGSGAVVMSASDPTPRLFEVALAVADHYGWIDFRSRL